MNRVLFVIVGLILGSGIFAQKFVQWRGDNRDGIYNETGLLKSWPENGPELLWHFENLGVGHASAAVTDNRVYTAGTTGSIGYVYAFDHDGNQLWKSEYGEEWIESWPGVRATPVIDNDKLYIMSGFNKVVCMNSGTGKILWSVDFLKDYDGRNIQWGICENLVIKDEKLLCTPGGKESNVVALDKNTGKLIWKSEGNGEKSAYNSPLLIKLSEREIFVTMTANSIIGIDASDGKMLWKHEQTNQYSVHANTPVYKDGYLYCFSGYGRGGVMLKLSDGGSSVSQVWRDPNLDSRMGGAVLLGGRLYGSGDKNRRWMCIDWNTGNELFSTTWMGKGNIIYADELFYLYSEKGEVGIVKVENDEFKPVSKFKVPYGSDQHWAHLVIKNKKLYVRHGNSLMVYSIKE